MKFRNIAALLALSTTLAACVSGDDSTPADSKPTDGFQAQFNTSLGIMPFPNDLYFNGSKTGQLNIPGDAAVAANGPLLEMNHLDGYGTQSDIKVYFTAPVDKSSLASNIVVLKVSSDPTTKAVTGVTKQLKAGVDYSVSVSPGTDSGGMVVNITPLHPLDASTVDPLTSTAVPATYLVIVTTGVKSADGSNATPSAEFKTIVTADTPAITKTGADPTKIAMAKTDPLFPVAEFTLAQLAVAAQAKIPLSDVAVAFSFSTQYEKLSLTFLQINATATTQPTGTGIFTTQKNAFDVIKLSGTTLTGTAATNAKMADIYAGDVALPYYLAVPAKGSTAALTDSWHNAAGGDTIISTDPATSETPVVPKAAQAQNVIPVLVSIPNANSPCAGTMPGAGWPVVVFQHGITRNREDMLAIAGTYASACIAVIAIDLPLHGVTDTTDPFYKNQLFAGTAAAAALTAPVSERTFDMDANGAAGATGIDIGGSGAQFINLNSTITSRDNLREGAADLINLVATLPNLHPVGATIGGFDSANVFFVGHSLGGIIGTTFLGANAIGVGLNPTQTSIVAATLAMPGGHIAKLLIDSPTFGPQINQGLAAQGLASGTQEYYDFLNEAQAVVDDGDPANYAAFTTLPLHMIEVVGNGGGNPPDQVVPNSATQVLIDAMGLDKITATTVNPAGVRGVVQFTAGDHGSILDPTASAAATTEMQTEALIFDAGFPPLAIPGNGEAIVINDTSVVKH